MIKADILLSDLSFDPVLEGDAIVFGGSRITPFIHPLLETLLVRTEDQWFATVRERLASQSSCEAISIVAVGSEAFKELYRACLQWPLDYIVIEGAKQGHRLKLRAGAIASAPVYCMALRDRVTVSWNFSDFLKKILWLDMEVLSSYLALQTVYSSRQICVGVNLLTERSTLHVEPGKALYRYPSAFERAASLPRSIDDEEALAEFGNLLHRIVAMRPIAPSQTATELSGGMDSATVACAVTRLHGSIASRGVLVEGNARASQIQRRQLIITKLGLIDDSVDMEAFPPSLDLQPECARMERPYGEYYLEAFEALWSSIQPQGRNTLFTGIGGDELFFGADPPTRPMSRNTIEEGRRCAEKILTERARSGASILRAFDAPASPVTGSALLANVCQAPYLLQRGIWPVNPLSDPNLIALCYQLPRGSRRDREVMRSYLQSTLGDVFARNYIKETFADVLPDAISKNSIVIAEQLGTCALADFGLVDQRAVLSLLDDIVATGSFALAAPFATFLWLERFVRQLN